LARLARGGRPLISESAIGTPEDVRRAGRSGADAVLVGTAILKAKGMTDLIAEMVSVGWPP
ncbi:MAG: hypothetical protein JW950_12340, partial [Deltaproteobacteria bacterium]|nr:hypothetical protein [Deltaproteobacteria bacterium]